MRAAIAVIAAALLLSGAAEARDWTADHRNSTLGFSAWRGLPNGGEREYFDAVFTVWSAEIRFDPAAPEAAAIVATIDVGSLNAGDGALNAEIVAAGWLDATAFPRARFVAKGFTPIEDGRYSADGVLTLRGVAAPVTIEFSLATEDDRAQAIGAGEVARADFEIGAHADGELAPEVIEVTFELRAVPTNEAAP